MSVSGLTTMRVLLNAAILEIDEWEASHPGKSIPVHRVSAIQDKLEALQGCGTVGLLRTGVAHVADTVAMSEFPLPNWRLLS